jgi:hypothetical protein
VTTNTPWLLSVEPPGPRELPRGARVIVALVVDASQLARGSSKSGLVFIKDARGSLHHDECVLVRVRVVA